MTILALDPGLTTGYAILDLTGSRLCLSPTAVAPAGILVPSTAGMPGQRILLRRWLRWIVPHVNEIAIEGEIMVASVPSMLEVVKVREIIDDTLSQLGKLPCYYAPSTVKSVIKRLSGSQDKGLPTKAELRRMLSPLLKLDWPLGVDHVSDAIAIAITHADKTHGWRPENYQPAPGKGKASQRLIDALHVKYDEAVNR
jgi:crossover junction endodeoxyribonuclease RuvC